MEMIGRLPGILLVGVALGLWVQLLAVMQRLKAREQQSRWASSLRDVMNMVCVLALVGAFRVTGLPWTAALLVAGTLGIAIDTIRYASRGRSPARSWALGLTVVLGLLAAAAAPEVARACDRVVVLVMDRGW